MAGKRRLLAAAIAVATLGATAPGFAASQARYAVASQVGALAPNAGGQRTYSLRVSRDSWEAAAFQNHYLMANDQPLLGAVVSRRFAVCDDTCFWQFFLQLGAGGTTGGPLLECTWGAILPLLPIWLPTRAPSYMPALRLDITTQMIGVRWRAVTWSYPLWLGISVPF